MSQACLLLVQGAPCARTAQRAQLACTLPHAQPTSYGICRQPHIARCCAALAALQASVTQHGSHARTRPRTGAEQMHVHLHRAHA
jgi:hypothetical protein